MTQGLAIIHQGNFLGWIVEEHKQRILNFMWGEFGVVTGRILTVETFNWPLGGGICSRGNIEVELRFDDCARLISEIRGIGLLRSTTTRGEIIEEALQEVEVVAQEVKREKE